MVKFYPIFYNPNQNFNPKSPTSNPFLNPKSNPKILQIPQKNQLKLKPWWNSNFYNPNWQFLQHNQMTFDQSLKLNLTLAPFPPPTVHPIKRQVVANNVSYHFPIKKATIINENVSIMEELTRAFVCETIEWNGGVEWRSGKGKVGTEIWISWNFSGNGGVLTSLKMGVKICWNWKEMVEFWLV